MSTYYRMETQKFDFVFKNISKLNSDLYFDLGSIASGHPSFLFYPILCTLMGMLSYMQSINFQVGLNIVSMITTCTLVRRN